MNTTDIDTALKMLDARGGALDKEAAKLIRQLQGEARLNAAIATMAKGDRDEIKASHDDIAFLNKENAQLKSDIQLLQWIKHDLETRKESGQAQELDEAWCELAAMLPSSEQGDEHGPLPLRFLAAKIRAKVADLDRRITLLETEHRGALTELSEVFDKLGRVLREHEGDFSDTDTAYLLADEAAMEIRKLRCQNADKQAQIDSLTVRYSDPVRGIVDACIPRTAIGLMLAEIAEKDARIDALQGHVSDFRGQLTHASIERAPIVKELKAQLEEKQARIDKLMERQQDLMNCVVDAQLQRGVFAPDHPCRLHPETGGGPALQFDGYYPPTKIDDLPKAGETVTGFLYRETEDRDPNAELRRNIKEAVRKVMDEPAPDGEGTFRDQFLKLGRV